MHIFEYSLFISIITDYSHYGIHGIYGIAWIADEYLSGFLYMTTKRVQLWSFVHVSLVNMDTHINMTINLGEELVSTD